MVGACLCFLLFQISSTLPRVVSDLHGLSSEGVASFRSIDKTTGNADALLKAATKRVDALSTTQTKLNTGIDLVTHRLTDLCSAPQGCGLIPDASRTLNTARGTMGQVEVAARSFDQHQSIFYQQEADLAKKTETTVDDLDRFVSSPDLLDTLHNLDSSSTALSSTAKHADAVAGDIQFEADRIQKQKKLGFWAKLVALL